MAEKYKGKVEFLLVYIREAHPTDGWQMQKNTQDGIQIASAKDFSQKEEYASSCVRNLGIKFTTVVDNMDAKVELNYMGWPDRMYVIGKTAASRGRAIPARRGFDPLNWSRRFRKRWSSHALACSRIVQLTQSRL